LTQHGRRLTLPDGYRRQYGIPALLDGLAAPLLRRIADETDAVRLTPGPEHLATEIVQRVLEALISFLVAAPSLPLRINAIRA
jgi:hypothetical protein